MVSETDLTLSDGRTLHVYDTGPGNEGTLTVLWHHGTPNIGAPPAPLFPDSARLNIRWVSYDRPGYGSSTPVPGRDIASAAEYAAAVADALDLGSFAAMGHSGGGPHALASARCCPSGSWPRSACPAGPVRRRGAGMVRGHVGRRPGLAAGRRAGPRGQRALRGRGRVRPGDVHPGRPVPRSTARGGGSARSSVRPSRAAPAG